MWSQEVTHLRKIMLEELQRRNYPQHTTRSYIRTVEDFARHFNCSPDRLAQSGFLQADLLACPSRVQDESGPRDN